MLLLLAGLVFAQDPAPSDAPAPAPEAPTGAATAPAAPDSGTSPPPLTVKVAGEQIDVTAEQDVLRKRAELFDTLVQEGYARRRRQGTDRTVFLSEDPWKPQVVVHDDGWVYFRRQPPRVHAPGKSFADQGSPAAYLLCIIAPNACISVGGWLVGERKLGGVKAQVMGATQDKIRAMNDAVARRELGRRLNEDIPNDLDKVWTQKALTPDQRKVLIFEYWDTRTDTPEGDAAKGAVEAFMRGVVQQSDTPYTDAELTKLNEGRESERPLVLKVAVEP